MSQANMSLNESELSSSLGLAYVNTAKDMNLFLEYFWDSTTENDDTDDQSNDDFIRLRGVWSY